MFYDLLHSIIVNIWNSSFKKMKTSRRNMHAPKIETSIWLLAGSTRLMLESILNPSISFNEIGQGNLETIIIWEMETIETFIHWEKDWNNGLISVNASNAYWGQSWKTGTLFTVIGIIKKRINENRRIGRPKPSYVDKGKYCFLEVLIK